MELLVLTDFHFAGAGARSTIPSRRGDLIPDILRRVRERETGLDAVAVLGDVIENGRHPAAADDLCAVYEALQSFDVPVLAVPGNHDRSPALFESVFGPNEPMKVGEVRLLPVVDLYDDADVCTLDMDALRRTLSSIRPGETAVVCQHSAVLPKVESSYPYTPPAYLEIAAAYREAGVALSLSGHYHDGMPPVMDGNVMHLCVPALCESPFSYARLIIRKGRIDVLIRNLGGKVEE